VRLGAGIGWNSRETPERWVQSEMGKVTLKDNSDEVSRDESLLKAIGKKAFHNDSL
jgi:hypothetical protein